MIYYQIHPFLYVHAYIDPPQIVTYCPPPPSTSLSTPLGSSSSVDLASPALLTTASIPFSTSEMYSPMLSSLELLHSTQMTVASTKPTYIESSLTKVITKEIVTITVTTTIIEPRKSSSAQVMASNSKPSSRVPVETIPGFDTTSK